MTRTIAVSALAAFALSALSPAAAVARQDPLTYDQTISCAAMFFVLSKQLVSQPQIEAYESGVVDMIVRADAMNAQVDQEQVIIEAATEADQILARMEAIDDETARNDIVWNWGPGIGACLAVLT